MKLVTLGLLGSAERLLREWKYIPMATGRPRGPGTPHGPGALDGPRLNSDYMLNWSFMQREKNLSAITSRLGMDTPTRKHYAQHIRVPAVTEKILRKEPKAPDTRSRACGVRYAG